LPATDHPALSNIANKLGFVSATALTDTLIENMTAIREAYDRIMN
jgi:hypothetical protein